LVYVEFNIEKKIFPKNVPNTLELMVKAGIKILNRTFNEEKYKFQFPVVRFKWG
jgi:hypothetical protein